MPETHGPGLEKGRNEPIVGNEWRTSVLMEVEVNVTVPRILYENTAKTAAEVCAIAGVGRRTFFAYLTTRKKASGDSVPSHG